MWNNIKLVMMFALSAGLAAGCNKSGSTATATNGQASTKYRLTSEPTNAIDVRAAREKVGDNDEVAVIGRIGGDTTPWVEGTAAFTIVDRQLKPCNEQADDACETPWDYCCDTNELPRSKAMVKVVDESGSTVTTDARELLGVKELQTVVVRGRAKRDGSGNLTVLANGVFVLP